MDEREVRYEVQGDVAVLTIDRERARNALSKVAMVQLGEGLDRAEQDLGVRVVVLTGAGERVFCAGGDLSTMVGDGFLDGHEGRRAYGLLLRRIQDLRLPTVARVNGHALAGGVGLLLACDLAVAADSVELGLPEIDRGLFPMTVMALLQRHLGRKRSLELVMTGQRLAAPVAVQWGLLNRAVPRAQLDEEVHALAQTLAQKSRAILALGKRAFFTAEDLALAPAVEHLASQLSLNVLAEDAQEGVSAFLEKRPPTWKDR